MKLPQIARKKLKEIAKVAKVAKVAKIAKIAEVARNCPKLPETARNCMKLPKLQTLKIAPNCVKLAEIAPNYPKLQKIASNCFELRHENLKKLKICMPQPNDVCREPSPLFTEARWIVHPRSVLQKSIKRRLAGRAIV